MPFDRRFDYLVKGNPTYETYSNYRPFGQKGIVARYTSYRPFFGQRCNYMPFFGKIKRTSILQSRHRVASTVCRLYEGTITISNREPKCPGKLGVHWDQMWAGQRLQYSVACAGVFVGSARNSGGCVVLRESRKSGWGVEGGRGCVVVVVEGAVACCRVCVVPDLAPGHHVSCLCGTSTLRQGPPREVRGGWAGQRLQCSVACAGRRSEHAVETCSG